MLSTIFQIIKAIPQLLGALKALVAFWLDVKNKFDESKNASIRREVENAKTEDERQKALDRASGKFGAN
jgi:hypothetical protein